MSSLLCLYASVKSEKYNMIIEILFSAGPTVFTSNMIRLRILPVSHNSRHSVRKPSSLVGTSVSGLVYEIMWLIQAPSGNK